MARLAIWLAVAAWLAIVAAVAPARARGANDLDKLNNQVVELYQQGKLDAAVVVAKRALALAERLRGPEHADVGICLVNLTTLYAAQHRLRELEPLLKRLLSLREKTLGDDHLDVELSLNSLALLYDAQGRSQEAEPFLRRSLAIREKALGPIKPGKVVYAVFDIGVLEPEGQFADGEGPLVQRFGLGVAASGGMDHGEAVQACCHVGVVGA